MKSTKCPQCGLVYWSSDAHCKRCGTGTSEPFGNDSASAQPQFAPQQPMSAYNILEDPAKAKLLKNLKGDAIFFYIVGGLQILVWFVAGQFLIVDGILNIGLSFLVHKFRSRVAAVVLLGLTLLGMTFGLLAVAAGMEVGFFFPIALIIRVLTSVRMVYTAFKLNGYVEEAPAKWLPPPPPNFHPEATAQWTPAEAAPQMQLSK